MNASQHWLAVSSHSHRLTQLARIRSAYRLHHQELSRSTLQTSSHQGECVQYGRSPDGALKPMPPLLYGFLSVQAEAAADIALVRDNKVLAVPDMKAGTVTFINI